MKALLPAPRALYGLTLLACLAAFLGALYMQHVEGLEPCPLCIFQRIALIVVMVILLIATHTAEHHPWAIIFKGQGRTYGCTWSLKGSYYVRVIFWFKIKSHKAIAKWESKRRYNLC